MASAFGQDAWKRLPACRGRHLHLDAFEPCGLQARTLGLGATNGWFAMRLRAFSLPRGTSDAEQRVADNWGQLSLVAGMPEPLAKQMLPNLACWPDLADFGVDERRTGCRCGRRAKCWAPAREFAAGRGR
jgi:hypothetical protein